MPLSNSLSLADRHRIRHVITKNRGKSNQEFCPFKYGRLLFGDGIVRILGVTKKVFGVQLTF